MYFTTEHANICGVSYVAYIKANIWWSQLYSEIYRNTCLERYIQNKFRSNCWS